MLPYLYTFCAFILYSYTFHPVSVYPLPCIRIPFILYLYTI